MLVRFTSFGDLFLLTQTDRFSLTAYRYATQLLRRGTSGSRKVYSEGFAGTVEISLRVLMLFIERHIWHSYKREMNFGIAQIKRDYSVTTRFLLIRSYFFGF